MKYPLKNPKKNTMTRFLTFFLFVAVLMIVSSSFTPQEVFATHLSEELKWQLVFISSQGCSLFNYEKMNQYDDVSEKYLEMYGLDVTKIDSICIPESEYISDYTPPHDLDLIILVYDKELGEKVLHSQKMGGLYSHTGSDRRFNHVIMICDCATFYYSDPVWILSHELAHFVLYYRNYEMSVIEDLIHSNDDQYDQCIDQGLNCESIVDKIKVESSARLFSVMPIYTPELLEKTENEKLEEKMRTSVIGISKMITKWWAAEKITDADYANAIGYLVDTDIIPSDENSQILFADDPLEDVVTWEEKFSEINSNLRGEVNTQENSVLLPNLNTNLIQNKGSVEEVILGLPDWFKTTAGWWAQDKITDEEFKKNIQFLVTRGILRPHASDILQKVINEEETLLEKSLQKLGDQVMSLRDSQDLTNEDIKKLLKKLVLTKTKFDFDNIKGGCKQLDGFVDSTSGLVDQSKLTQKIGQSLIDSADLIKFNYCKT
jgi:hypothetical protein